MVVGVPVWAGGFACYGIPELPCRVHTVLVVRV